MEIGNFVKQPSGYEALSLNEFPPSNNFKINSETSLVNNEATLALGKLDGVAQLVPDIDFFTYMYIRKEAALSSNIEGTKATMNDAIKADIKITEGVPKDVENILHYITAINYGLKRLEDIPLSSRLIREIHNKLLEGTEDAKGNTPGEFRKTQNWIGGTRPDNADFVPPPPHELNRNLKDFDNFLHEKQPYSPLIQTGLMHAQFETIHPFLDGNGRTGRLLITLNLCSTGILEYPILYLSEYFKRHREVYFKRLAGYHDKGEVNRWLQFFLEGVRDVSEEATAVSKGIVDLREKDLNKMHSLGGKQSPSAVKLLMGLFKQPIVDVAAVEDITGLSRPAANSLVKKFIDMQILKQTNESETYGREFRYVEYLKLFETKNG